jgi:sigma-B regulation protein RsbU (phosphoserine phosphatase)
MNEHSEIQHLRTLVEASKLINSSIEPDALFASILSVTRQQLGVERGTLYFADEKRGEIWSKVAGELGDVIRLPIGRGIAGAVAETGRHIVLHDAYSDERFDPSHDVANGYRTRSMLCTPIKNRGGKVVGVLQLLNKIAGSFGEADLRFLDAISDHMAIAMENATLHLALVEKQRMERELQLGREIQRELFPMPPQGINGVSIAARNIPCYEVGGDYYDFLELPDDDLGIVIGDVSGKGVSAALIMSSLQAALRVAAPMEDDLSMLVSRLNTFVYAATRGRKYVTCFFGRYNPASGVLRYVNAGHNPPFVVNNGSVHGLHSTGKPIGILPGSATRRRRSRCRRGRRSRSTPTG